MNNVINIEKDGVQLGAIVRSTYHNNGIGFFSDDNDGLQLGYMNLPDNYLIGTDCAWIEELRVDQETNMVYIIDSPFSLYENSEERISSNLHDELNCISRALSIYWDLKYYADYAGVQIFNASKYSLIDAYERKKEID